MPRVSIIIPVYQAEKELPRCLDSLLAQQYQDWEAILVNDGSRDGSGAVLQRYAEKDARLRYINQPNAGPGAARNTALDVAQGEFICFVDSDDVVPEQALQALVSAMEGNDLVVAHFQIFANNRLLERGLIKDDRQVDKRGFLDLVIKWPGSYYYSALWNKLYRRSVIEEAGLRFDTTVIWGEDCMFNMNYYRHVSAVHYIPDTVYRYDRKVTGLSWMSLFKIHKGIRIKYRIYSALKQLYEEAGLYRKYYWRVQLYIFNVTLMY